MDASTLSTTFINKVPQILSGQHFIINTEWRTNDINLQVLDIHRSKEWQGNVTFDNLRQSADELEIPYEMFLNECREALTTNGGVESFQYLVENDKFYLNKRDQFKIQYLEVDLTSNDSEIKSGFALAAVDLIASLRKELSHSKEISRNLDEKYQTMVTTIEKCLQEKNDLEHNLLSKFVVLLNSKKDKIAQLQDLLVEKNKMLENAGISSEETSQPNEQKSTNCADNDDSDDFMQPTQVMTQPVGRSLPKRVKLGS